MDNKRNISHNGNKLKESRSNNTSLGNISRIKTCGSSYSKTGNYSKSQAKRNYYAKNKQKSKSKELKRSLYSNNADSRISMKGNVLDQGGNDTQYIDEFIQKTWNKSNDSKNITNSLIDFNNESNNLNHINSRLNVNQSIETLGEYKQSTIQQERRIEDLETKLTNLYIIINDQQQLNENLQRQIREQKEKDRSVEMQRTIKLYRNHINSTARLLGLSEMESLESIYSAIDAVRHKVGQLEKEADEEKTSKEAVQNQRKLHTEVVSFI